MHPHKAQTSVTIHASSKKVWDAITSAEITRKTLMGTNVHTDWKEGSDITWEGTYEGKSYKDKGIIQKSVPGEQLQYTYWSSMSGKEDLPENYQLVTYQLRPEEDKTVLTLTQNNIHTEKEKEHSTENWKTVLKKLKELIEES